MLELFSDTPEAIDNTLSIAERCQVEMPKATPHMPRVKVPNGMDEDSYLRQQCLAGLKERGLPATEKYLQRMDYELSVIKKTGFPSYFLIVADVIKNAKDNSILVGPGRGSAAGSLVSFALGITDLDPIEYGLLFERFLNPERINMPDIDIDFQDNRREEIIDYCRKKYGGENISQIITYGKLKAKAVFKDVARVYEVDFETSNKLSALIGDAQNLKKAYENNVDFKEIIHSGPLFREVYDQSLKLEGLTRQTGIHAAGVIIADKKIDEYCPLSSDEDHNVVTQFEGTVLESHCGLIKMDFLGLKTLTILDQAIKLIKKHHGVNVDLASIPLQDKATYNLLSSGRAVGVFQFESSGMRKYLKELKPTTLDDLTAMNAMYRPGPLAWIPVYIAKKNHKPVVFNNKEDEVNFKALEELCEHNEVLKSILSPTNLIPIYQEQIMEIGQKFAGFTLGKADVMRRAMGKKKLDILVTVKEEFLNGADKLFGLRKEANFLYEKIIMPFANYGFNKSHAACYALVAYQTAYLKANYPECFLAALLNSEIENTDKIKEYIEETKLLGVKIIPPGINESQLHFTVVENSIIYSLGAIKGVAASAGGEIIKDRKKEGPYASFVHFLRRNSLGKVNKQNVEQLIKAGCFDGFDLDIEQLLFAYPQLQERIAEENLRKIGGQTSFFEGGQEARETHYDDILKEAAQIQSKANNLKEYEKAGLGFNIKYDPLLKHYTELGHLCTLDITKKDSWSDGQEITMAGNVARRRIIQTKKGDDMCFVSLDNGRGNLDTVVFPKLYAKLNQKRETLLQEGNLLIIKGKVQNNDRGLSLLADSIEPYTTEAIPTHKYKNLHIEFSPASLSKDELGQLKKLLHSNYGGSCLVYLHFNTKDKGPVTIKVGDALYVKPNRTLTDDLKAASFVEKVWFN